MTFESYRSKGRLSTLLMVVSTIISGFVSFLSLDNDLYISIIFLSVSLVIFILFLIAMNGFGKYYSDSRIFKNSLYPIIISLIAGNIYRIFHYTFIIPFLEESTTLSTSLPVVGGLWIITAVVALINGILYRRAFSALAEKSGEDNFKKAGEYMFFGGVTTIIFVGIFGFFIGWILAFKGFSSMKRKVK